MASEVRIKLLRFVRNNPQVRRNDIRAHKDFEDEEDRTLANLLYNSKKDQHLAVDSDGRYTLTAIGEEYLNAAGAEPSRRTTARANPSIPMPSPGRRDSKNKTPPPVIGAVARAAATAGIADKLLSQAQNALDEYIASVCDPQILARFKAARDAARDVVKSLDEPL